MGETSGNTPAATKEKGRLSDALSWPMPELEGFDTPETKPPSSFGDGLVSLVTAVRWGTTSLGLLWATALGSPGEDLAIGVVLLAYSLYRTFRPVEYSERGWRSLLSILTELALTVGAIVATGCWDSPYIFVLFTPVIAAGFARGWWHAFRISITGAGAVGLAAYLLDSHSGIRPVVAWSGELILVAAVASYGRRLLTRAEEVGALNLNQLWRLNEANALLVSLNRLAHDLPVSFDFQETISNTLERVREATNPDITALLLLDPLTRQWSVAIAEGARISEHYSQDQLPAAVRAAAYGTQPQLIRNLSADNPGFAEPSGVGLYVPLWAGPRQVGLLAVEAVDRDRFGTMQVELLRELAEPVALTIDNARWFDRLRARGAAQERSRLARDLHDRVGQGVAYVAFELDRLSHKAKGTELDEDLNALRADARTMVRELRETLYDLRTDVSDEHGFAEVVNDFLNRVSGRSALVVHFEQSASRRLPLSQERELWRITQEAIVNAERHADAGSVSVKWDADEHGGELTVSDDGVGLAAEGERGYGEPASPGRPSYGLTGMRERAESLGGVLEVSGNMPTGTTVRLLLGNRRRLAVNPQEPERTSGA